ncbi:MAG: DUF1559 domain-containing protein [Planctomyces sp.]|nr:DUF1559 domain-containing protein [Planctomyces sp.]
MESTSSGNQRSGTQAARQSSGSHQQVRHAGFSLIELLIVIAVIGILLAITLPALQKARESARRTECANNMRQIGLAIHQFCQTHKNQFPKSSHSTSNLEETWIYQIAPYLENVDRIRICPEDPKGAERIENKGTSYILNEYLCVQGPNAALSLNSLDATSRTIMVFTISDSKGTSTTEDHTHSRNWFKNPRNLTWNRILSDIQPDRFGGASTGTAPEKRNSGYANYLFADGHVQLIPASTVRQWADQEKNFSLPDGCPELQ